MKAEAICKGCGQPIIWAKTPTGWVRLPTTAAVQEGAAIMSWRGAVSNLGVIALTGFALWYTHSLWAFLALFFMVSGSCTDE